MTVQAASETKAQGQRCLDQVILLQGPGIPTVPAALLLQHRLRGSKAEVLLTFPMLEVPVIRRGPPYISLLLREFQVQLSNPAGTVPLLSAGQHMFN